jgi:hypothetical protein
MLKDSKRNTWIQLSISCLSHKQMLIMSSHRYSVIPLSYVSTFLVSLLHILR